MTFFPAAPAVSDAYYFGYASKFFGVDITTAQGLAGAELAAWLEQAEDQVFHRELAELQRQRQEGTK